MCLQKILFFLQRNENSKGFWGFFVEWRKNSEILDFPTRETF